MPNIKPLSEEEQANIQNESMQEISGIGLQETHSVKKEDLMDLISQVNSFNPQPVKKEESPEGKETPEKEPAKEDQPKASKTTTSEFSDKDYEVPVRFIPPEEDNINETEEEYEEEYEEEPPHKEPVKEDPEIEESEEKKENPKKKAAKEKKKPPVKKKTPKKQEEEMDIEEDEPVIIKNPKKGTDNKDIVKYLLYFLAYNAAAWIIAVVLWFL